MYDSNIKSYRESLTGSNCKFCKYCKYHNTTLVAVPDYYECILRDKIIHFPCRAKLCRYYTIKEE